MKLGQPQDVILNYSSLYKLNPETARTVVLEVLKQTGNISQTASCFNTTRKVVQLAIKKEKDGNLADKSHRVRLGLTAGRPSPIKQLMSLKKRLLL